MLNKGLNYNINTKTKNLDSCFDEFERKLQIEYYFFDDYNDANYNYTENLIKTRSEWRPKNYNRKITEFVNTVKTKLQDNIKDKRIKRNVSRTEILTLKTLREKPIIIRPADKSAGIAVLDEEAYVKGCLELLNKEGDYKTLEKDITMEIFTKANDIIDQFYNIKIITKKEQKFLKTFTPKLPNFYGNPKLHKQGNPLRPIVSQIDGPTSRLNELADKILAPAEALVPFLLKDTISFLQQICNQKIKKNSYLVTLDVASLYTRIPTDEGVEMVTDWYCNCCPKGTPKPLLIKLLKFILNNNIFQFNNIIYLQTHGTAMGCRMAVKYANIFMYKKWTQIIQDCDYRPMMKPLRLIDDIFFIWEGDQERLIQFYNIINNKDTNIKFEINYSQHTIHFLDTQIQIKNEIIKTTPFIKPTDKQAFLSRDSAHPNYCFNSLPYSQFLRYRRLTTDDEDLPIYQEKLKKAFKLRGYSEKILNQSINKTSNIKQETLLNYKIKKIMTRTPLIVPFTFETQPLKKILENVWETKILSDNTLSIIFQQPPILTFSETNKISKFITKSKYPPSWPLNNKPYTPGDEVGNSI